MAWNLSGELIESCSCNMFCPCWFGVPELMEMDQGWCNGILAFRVNEGNANGTDLGGRAVVLSAHFPGPTMFDGNGTGRIYVDEGADDEQERELEAIFKGEKGGPMANIAPLISTWQPTRRANVDINTDGETITVSAEGAGEMQSKLLRDGEGNAFAMRGGGFIAAFGFEEVNLAPTSSQWTDDEIPGRFEVKSGGRGDIAWSA
jgi:hypothetical protein